MKRIETSNHERSHGSAFPMKTRASENIWPWRTDRGSNLSTTLYSCIKLFGRVTHAQSGTSICLEANNSLLTSSSQKIHATTITDHIKFTSNRTKPNMFFPNVMSQQHVHQLQSPKLCFLAFLDISRNLCIFLMRPGSITKSISRST